MIMPLLPILQCIIREMTQDALPLLQTLTQLTEEGSVTEDSLLQLCEEQPGFYASICQFLEPYQPGASDAAYKWLFMWFSTPVAALRRYALQFIPQILSTYLTALHSPDAASGTLKKRCEICLSALLQHLREPTPSPLSLSNATSYSSPYYYPSTPLDRQTGRESASEGATPTRLSDSKPAVTQRINGSTRPALLPLILAAFTDELSSVSTPVKLSFCRAVTVISASGLSDIPTSPYLSHCLDKQEHNSQSLPVLYNLQERQRIRVSQPLLIEMCQGLKFCLNRAVLVPTLQATECVYFRSLLEAMPQAMLCSNALLNLLSEELSEEMREFELSSPAHSASTPVEAAGDATLEFELTEHTDSTVV